MGSIQDNCWSRNRHSVESAPVEERRRYIQTANKLLSECLLRGGERRSAENKHRFPLRQHRGAGVDRPSHPCVTEQQDEHAAGTQMLAGVRGHRVTHFIFFPNGPQHLLLPWRHIQSQEHLTLRQLENTRFEAGGRVGLQLFPFSLSLCHHHTNFYS